MNPIQEKLLRLLSYSPPQSEPFLRDWTAGEWEAVVNEADRHDIVPMLHHRMIRRFPGERIPASVSERLQRGHQACAFKNLGRFQALAPVLASLSKAGIPVIVLKGAYLAAAVYENFSLRQMSDVDLLLHPEDIPKADPVLIGAGFLRNEHEAIISPGRNEVHYRQRSGPFRIEVHWELYAPDYPFRFDLAEMWRAATPAQVAGVDALAFCPEDQLIHLTSHAVVHRFEFGLRPFVDLAEVIARLRIDWPHLAEKAGRQNVGRVVGVPLALARELLQVDVPAEAIAGLGDGDMPRELFAEARETLLLNARGKREKGEPNPNLVLFFGRRRWRERLALARRRLFPSRQALAVIYPVAADSPGIWFCYCRRFFGILGRNLRGMRTLLIRRIRRPFSRNQAGELMDWLLK